MENYYSPPYGNYIEPVPYSMRDGYNVELSREYGGSYEVRREDDMQKSYSKTPSFMPKEPSLGMAYVPYQSLNHKIYDEGKALERGTIFADLDMPFTARWSVPNG